MANQKQSTAAKKIRKKVWIELVAPEMFGNAYIGETHVYEPEELIGKTATVNLMTVTNDPKKQGSEIQFEVVKYHEGQGLTVTRSLSMTPSGVKRLLRKRKDRIADSQVFRTADARRIRLKYVLIALSPTSAAIRADLRNETKEMVSKALKKITFDTLIRDVVSYKFQRFVKESLRKLFPIMMCEIKYVGLEASTKEEVVVISEKVEESEYFDQSELPPPRPRKFSSRPGGRSQGDDESESGERGRSRNYSRDSRGGESSGRRRGSGESKGRR